MSRRRAHTLIELTVTMTVGSALMILTVGFIHQAMSLSSTARARSDQHRTMDRLSRDFRHDVHLAEEVSITDEQNLRLKLDNGTVAHYSAARGQIRREIRGEDPIITREQYSLPAALKVEFSTNDEPRRVSISLNTATLTHGPYVEREALVDDRLPSKENQTVRRMTAVLSRTLAHQEAEVKP